ncbi:MAG: Uma2 family endonuclease [Schwartzia sp.]|nr:Uma2 family endonuclease [Schwartzia sp. (in: firmicutes)]
MSNTAVAYHDDLIITEIIDGQEVAMSPRPALEHSHIILNLARIFSIYLRGKRCKAFVEPELILDEKNHFAPDLAIVCDKSKMKANGIYGAPDLVVEVLSPATMTRDKGIKKATYEAAGVREYWIVSPLEKSIEVYHLKEGRFQLDGVYCVFPEWEWERMSEDERAAARLSVKVSLYDDLLVDVREVFEE